MDRPLEPAMAPRFRLFSHYQIGGATFLGTPLAAAVLLAINYRRLRRPRAAWIALAIGLAVTALLVLLSFVPTDLPDTVYTTIWDSLMSIFIALAGFRAAEVAQGRALAAHKREGGRLESGWTWVGISLATTLLVLSPMIALLLLAV
jgi:hypothetical protein